MNRADGSDTASNQMLGSRQPVPDRRSRTP